MCFRDPYDSLDASTLRQLNNILLEEARNKEGIRKAKENAKEMKRQDKEQKRIAKVKSRLEKKYGPRMQPEPDSRKKYESSSSSSEEPEYRQHRRHYRRSRDSQRVVSCFHTKFYRSGVDNFQSPSLQVWIGRVHRRISHIRSLVSSLSAIHSPRFLQHGLIIV